MIPSMSSSLNHSWIISNIKGDRRRCGGSRWEAKAPAGVGATSGGGQQTGQQGDQGNADEGNTTARHELLDALVFGGRVVLAVTFQKVDAAPHAQAAAQGDDQSLQNVDSVSKKAHIHISFRCRIVIEGLRLSIRTSRKAHPALR